MPNALGRDYAKLLTKTRQALWPKVMAGPAGRVLSRTGTRWGRFGATSTHSLLPPLYELVRHRAPDRSGVLWCALFMLDAPRPCDG
ncbi:hypothetical protein GCM10010221_15330 [Streptomyces parvus]|nr:hypothetical protein GCM10010221_15330 [Streptomyces parvus]